MAFALRLSPPWPDQGWKIKIRDRERNEPPHVTFLRGTKCWRFGLREAQFLDKEPDPKEVPRELVDVVRNAMAELRAQWDSMYPHNPVQSREDDDG